MTPDQQDEDLLVQQLGSVEFPLPNGDAVLGVEIEEDVVPAVSPTKTTEARFNELLTRWTEQLRVKDV
jgi:hypothetical protein